MITRIITTIVQLALLAVVVPMVYAIYLDIKNGGLNDN
jgi:hypothetical protein